MEALSRQSTVLEAVYAALRDSICEGRLTPGERLTQDDIADQLGVSRQPVGQALILLKSQGFVSETGRRGLVVASLRIETVRDIYELRGALDGLAASLAAQRAGPELLARGTKILDEGRELVERGDVAGLLKADMAFHDFLYEASKNPLIEPALTAHWHQLRRVMTGVIEQDSYRAQLWDEHAAILDAIAAGDEDRAGRLARCHVAAACAALCAKLETAQDNERPVAIAGTTGR